MILLLRHRVLSKVLQQLRRTLSMPVNVPMVVLVMAIAPTSRFAAQILDIAEVESSTVLQLVCSSMKEEMSMKAHVEVEAQVTACAKTTCAGKSFQIECLLNTMVKSFKKST